MDDKLVIEGGHSLQGSVSISGAKNAALPILVASLLAPEAKLTNIPNINDVNVLIEIIRNLNVKIDFKSPSLAVDSRNMRLISEDESDICSKIRYSLLLTPILASRFGGGFLPYPGGCSIGNRPIDQHLKMFKNFGIQVFCGKKGFRFKTAGLKPCDHTFDISSVGATENALICAALTKGTSTLRVCSIEPEVQDLERFLVKLGVKIDGIGQTTKVITSTGAFTQKISYRIISDRIEAATYILAGLITNSEIEIQNVRKADLKPFLDSLDSLGVEVDGKRNQLKVKPSKAKPDCAIHTEVWPGFPTDVQPLMTAWLCFQKGNFTITDKIFPDRFYHVKELRKMNAKIRRVKNKVVIQNLEKPNLSGSHVVAFDLRTGASVLLAALGVKGKTSISNTYQIHRGYENLVEKLTKLGAKIKVA